MDKENRVAFVSLGCDKNRVDTEYMLGLLTQNGYRIVQDPDEADFVVVNTCAFLETARAEAIDTILSLSSGRPAGQKLVVSGCLPEKYLSELSAGLPEVDAFLGIEARGDLLTALTRLRRESMAGRPVQSFSMVGKPHEEDFENRARVLTTPPHLAYLKIADGCDNRCTYCLIPSIRGRYRSVPMERLVAEAADLVEEGVTELVLVAQDLTRYGADLYGAPRLPELIRELSQLDLVWIRLLYCYPESVTEELIAEISRNPKVAKYIDIPLQHVSDSVLKRMGRRSSRAQIEKLIQTLRAQVPGIAIRSTFIVGFPGETEENFSELLEFLDTYRLDHAGFFAYSDEEDAPSFRLPDKVSEEVKAERLSRALSLCEKLQAERLVARVGKMYRAVCDGADFDADCFVGRTESEAPEVDTRLILSGEGEIGSGAYYEVEITGRQGDELLAKIL